MARNSDPLRVYLRNLAGWAWNRQGDAFKHGRGLCLHEETITEMLLLRMARDASKHAMRVQMFSKPQEKLNGADWEWSIRTKFCVHRLRVQAKRLYHHSAAKPDYGSLDPTKRQHTRLLSEAKKAKFTPAYVFYNHDHGVSSASFLPATGGEFHGPSHWGCTIAHARNVKSSKVVDLISVMTPWHELIDPKVCGLTLIAAPKAVSPVPVVRTAKVEEPEPALTLPEPPQLEWRFFEKPPGALEEYLDEKQLAGVAYMDFSNFKANSDVPG